MFRFEVRRAALDLSCISGSRIAHHEFAREFGSPQSANPLMAREKFRIRFKKVGDLRMISHHDLMRCFERMLRRAALPFRSTEGFNPKPKMAFALSLALGIEGWDEVVELELESPSVATSSPESPSETEPPAPASSEPEAVEIISEKDLHQRLAAQAPAGLQILTVRRIEPRLKAQPRRAVYQIDLPPERCHGVPERIIAVLAESETWVERTRPETRRVNVRPYLRDLRLDGTTLEMDLWVTPTGTARPDDILGLLELSDLLTSGAVLRRTLLELHDESADGGGLPPGMDAPASVATTPVE
jgi:uncharacterized protein (DUF2344 family)